MADLAERVAALERRVGELEIEVRRAGDLGVTAGREALTARRAHQRNIELLNALRATQAEHGQTLAEHTDRFDAVDGKLGQLAVGMHTIESLHRRKCQRPDSSLRQSEPMTLSEVETEVMQLLLEDDYGLWEIAWRLRSAERSGAAAQSAAAVVEGLRRRGFAELYVREWVDAEPVPVGRSHRQMDLRNRASWREPSRDEAQLLLGITDAGRDALAQSGEPAADPDKE